jgi:uncharacterized protein YodC (DUF2158 family)
MSQNTFKVGDPVQIKAGNGPAMTVVRGTSTELVCTWYNPHTGKYEEAVFPAAALRLAVTPELHGGFGGSID